MIESAQPIRPRQPEVENNQIPLAGERLAHAIVPINCHGHRQILIFPEGTRVAPGAKAPYHPGTAALYTGLDLPVVPVALNSGMYWSRNAFWKTPGRIVVEVLPAIPPGGRADAGAAVM